MIAPGFIDLHAHGQNLGDYRMQAMQGVTTMLELESGVLPVSAWYEGQAGKRLPINYGTAAGWTYARIATFTETEPEATVKYFQDARALAVWKMDLATPEQQEKILRYVEQGLDEGGWGSASMPAMRRVTGGRSTSPWPSWPPSATWRPTPTSAMPAT